MIGRFQFSFGSGLVQGIWSTAMLIFLLSCAGCASTEKVRVLNERAADRVIERRDTAVVATVIASEVFGKKYLESWLTGLPPADAKSYANLVFRIENVIKGRAEELELRLHKVDANWRWAPMIGTRYLIGFDGPVDNPRKLMLVPIPPRDGGLDQ